MKWVSVKRLAMGVLTAIAVAWCAGAFYLMGGGGAGRVVESGTVRSFEEITCVAPIMCVFEPDVDIEYTRLHFPRFDAICFMTRITQPKLESGLLAHPEWPVYHPAPDELPTGMEDVVKTLGSRVNWSSACWWIAKGVDSGSVMLVYSPTDGSFWGKVICTRTKE